MGFLTTGIAHAQWSQQPRVVRSATYAMSSGSALVPAVFATVVSVLLLSLLQVGIMEKMVLVSVGDNKRIVSFSTPAVSADTEALTEAIRVSFKDILQPGQDFFLQLKSEEWGGVFLDLLQSQEIFDRSVVNVVMKPMSEVGSSSLPLYSSILTLLCSYILLCTINAF